MGLLKGVLLLPLAPLSGLRWLAEVLGEEAEALENQLVAELLSRRGPGGGA
jgi:hypothetical protein